MDSEVFDKYPDSVKMPHISKKELIAKRPMSLARLPSLLDPKLPKYASMLTEEDKILLADLSVCVELFFPTAPTKFSPHWRLGDILSAFPGVDRLLSTELMRKSYISRPCLEGGQAVVKVFLKMRLSAVESRETATASFLEIFHWLGAVVGSSRALIPAKVHGFMEPAYPTTTSMRLELMRAFVRDGPFPDQSNYLYQYNEEFVRMFCDMGPGALDHIDITPSHRDFLKAKNQTGPLAGQFSKIMNEHIADRWYVANAMFLYVEEVYPRTFTAVYDEARMSDQILLGLVARFPLTLWDFTPQGTRVGFNRDEQNEYMNAVDITIQIRWVNGMMHKSQILPQRDMNHMVSLEWNTPVSQLYALIVTHADVINDSSQWIDQSDEVRRVIRGALRLYRWSIRYRAMLASDHNGMERQIFMRQSEDEVVKRLSALDPDTLAGYIHHCGFEPDWPLSQYAGLRDSMAVNDTSFTQLILYQCCLAGFEKMRLDQCSTLVALHACLANKTLRVNATYRITRVGRFLRLFASMSSGPSLKLAQEYTESVGFHTPKVWKKDLALDIVDELNKSLEGLASHWDLAEVFPRK